MLAGLESPRVFHHDCMLIAIDCLNAAVDPGSVATIGVETMHLERFERYVVPKYKTFFSRATPVFQKCIYVRSPYANFWGNFPYPDVYAQMVEQIAALAKQRGFIVFNSTPLFATLAEFRRDSWHFCIDRGKDWGLQAAWQRFLQKVSSISGNTWLRRP